MVKYYKLMLSFVVALLGMNNIQAQENISYDYDFNATVLCSADYYGTRRSDGNRQLHNYYIVLGDKALNDDGMPATGSTVYALDFFGAAPAYEYSPNPAAGTYTFSDKIENNVLYHDIHVYQVDGNGNYEIDRAFTDGKLEISTYEADGEVYYKYEATLVDEKAKTHHVTYQSRFIVYNDLSQASLDLEKDLDFKGVSAFASYRSIDNGIMNILLEISDLHRVGNDYYYDPLPGRIMTMELYVPSGQNLVDGTYVADELAGDAFTLETGEIVTMSGVQYPVGSYVQYVFGNKSVSWGCVQSGTLTVSSDGVVKKIVGDFVTNYGFVIKFVYEGELNIANIPQTGFGSDVALDLDGATAQFECVGDVDKLNRCRNWYITILPAEGKDHGFISYICSRTESFFDGIGSATYTASPSRTPWKEEYQKGKKNDNGQLSGTWALTGFDANGQPQVNAPAADGDLNITRHDDDKTYTIEFDLNDGAGHNFKGKWTGEPEMLNSCGDEPPAGIDDIIAEQGNKTVEGIYNLNGFKSTGSVPGIYLIRYTDGTVSKVIVK